MTTETKVNRPIQVAHESGASRRFNQFVIVIASLLVVLVGVVGFVTTRPASENEVHAQPLARRTHWDSPNRPDLGQKELNKYLAANPELLVAHRYAAVAEAEARAQRAGAAEATRYSSMGAYYAAGNEAQRANQANAARYSGLAVFYGADDQAGRQRANEAETARYTGLAMLHKAEKGANLQRANEANAARYTGLATSYTNAAEKKVVAAFLAANPELLMASRYATLAEWHRHHFPGR
jgi:hypothetical protein